MIETTPQYWDCECAAQYIHKASEYSERNACRECGAVETDQPDSRTDEVRHKMYHAPVDKSRKVNVWNREFEADFYQMMIKHFGEESWDPNWEDEDEGFTLRVSVWTDDA